MKRFAHRFTPSLEARRSRSRRVIIGEYVDESMRLLREISALLNGGAEMDLGGAEVIEISNIAEELRSVKNTLLGVGHIQDVVYSECGTGVISMAIAGDEDAVYRAVRGIMHPETAGDDKGDIDSLIEKKMNELSKNDCDYQIHREEKSSEDYKYLIVTSGGRRIMVINEKDVCGYSDLWRLEIDFGTPSKKFAQQIMRSASQNNDLEWDFALEKNP